MEVPPLSPDYREFFASLHRAKADYLLVGGYAVCLHGCVRNTDDLDIWVGHDPDNAERVYKAVVDFVGKSEGLSPAKFAKPSSILFIGVEPYRLDIFTSLPGVDFEECAAKSVPMQIDDLTLNTIDLDSLILNKKTVGRPQDLEDVRQLSR
jgi:hypothetical protein